MPREAVVDLPIHLRVELAMNSMCPQRYCGQPSATLTEEASAEDSFDAASPARSSSRSSDATADSEASIFSRLSTSIALSASGSRPSSSVIGSSASASVESANLVFASINLSSSSFTLAVAFASVPWSSLTSNCCRSSSFLSRAWRISGTSELIEAAATMLSTFALLVADRSSCGPVGSFDCLAFASFFATCGMSRSFESSSSSMLLDTLSGMSTLLDFSNAAAILSGTSTAPAGLNLALLFGSFSGRSDFTCKSAWSCLLLNSPSAQVSSASLLHRAAQRQREMHKMPQHPGMKVCMT
mmetsp:Transcript_78701/g.143764  ORF Transcript_78701/g.143764 Transcript_78701/m.143764 type:complete len:299 (+) Transcript_78701:466-1362(+)